MKIFLIGDSTCQTYGDDMAPQQGWGREFYRYFKSNDQVKISELTHEKPKAIQYEMPLVTIENWAASARSSRSYIEEGRLDLLSSRIGRDDYVFIQFSHNDAHDDSPDRYVAPGDFCKWLSIYHDRAVEHGAVPVFLSAITKRNADTWGDGQFHYPFDDYRSEMQRMCRLTDSPFIDFGEGTLKYCREKGSEEMKKIYLYVNPGDYPESTHCIGKKDDIHLNYNGAYTYAGILVNMIKQSEDPKLNRLKSYLL